MTLRARRRLALGVTLTLAAALTLLALPDDRRLEATEVITATVRPSALTTVRPRAGPTLKTTATRLAPIEKAYRLDIRGIEPYPWHYFEVSQRRRLVIEAGADKVKRAPQKGPELLEFVTVVDAALVEVRWSTGDRSYNSSDALGGRYRYVPGAGVQYELYFRGKGAAPTEFHTVRVTRPLAAPQMMYVGSGKQSKNGQQNGIRGNKMINIIMPYYNRLSTLQRFVRRFVALVEAKQDLVLTVVRYSQGFPPIDAKQAQKDRAGVARLLSETNKKLASCCEARVRLVNMPGTFSRGDALMGGVRAWRDANDHILFLCDVDMVFGKGFLQRCRANTEPGRKAYFPIVYMTHNPEIVSGVTDKKTVPILTNYEKNTLVDNSNGYWINFAFGMSCQYRSDFLRLSGGYFNVPGGWGLEDNLLYEHFRDSDVEIVRMPDPDLVHVYHKSHCDENGKRYKPCMASKAQTEASRVGWGLWVFKHLGDTDNIKEFLEKYHSSSVKADGSPSFKGTPNSKAKNTSKKIFRTEAAREFGSPTGLTISRG